MQEKFLLKHNPFVIFIYAYAPIVIFGMLAIKYIGGFLPDLLHEFLDFLIFAFGIYKGVDSLLKNKQFLMVSQNNIALCTIKNKKPQILKSYKNIDILKIDATDTPNTGVLVITKTDNNIDNLDVSTVLKPNKGLLLKINSSLYKIFNKKLLLDNYEEVEKYLDSYEVPTEYKENKSDITILAIVYAIFAILPTWIGILCTFIMICSFIIFTLKILKIGLGALIAFLENIKK